MNNGRGRGVIYLVGLASIFLILFGIRGLASIINPILLAAVITITVLPLPGALTKRGLPGWLALVVSILAVVVTLGLVMAVVFFSVTKLAIELPAYLESASQQGIADFGARAEEVTTAIGPLAQGVLAATLSLLAQFGMALLIFIFMIAAALALPTPSRMGLDPNTQVVGRVASLTEDVRKYMTVLTGINLLVGLGDTILLLIIGVDYAVLWGLLAWIMGYIPSLGFWIALIPPVLLAYAEFGLPTALVVFVAYVLINGGVQNFVQPKLMGQRLKISPVVVFVGLFIWGFVLGGIGAILAVPMTLLTLIIMENFEGTRPLAILMRYTGEEKNEERKAAEKHVKGLWGRVKETVRPVREPEDTVREPEEIVREPEDTVREPEPTIRGPEATIRGPEPTIRGPEDNAE
jgi:AI-2 transport protein TqsA